MLQVAFCFEEPGHLQIAEGGRILDPSESLFSGTATFVRSDGSENRCTPVKGPLVEFDQLDPAEDSEDSAPSHSDSLSHDHREFRLSVFVRDAFCLLSDDDYDGCDACHILPESKPELFDLCALPLSIRFTRQCACFLPRLYPVLLGGPWKKRTLSFPSRVRPDAAKRSTRSFRPRPMGIVR